MTTTKRRRSVYLGEGQWEALAELAAREDRSVNWFVRQAIATYLANRAAWERTSQTNSTLPDPNTYEARMAELALGRDEPFVPEPGEPPVLSRTAEPPPGDRPAIPSTPENLVEMGPTEPIDTKPVKP